MTMNPNMTPSDQLQSWLASQAGIAGLLACGVGFSNKTCICASASDAFQGPAMNLAMRCLSDSYDVAGLHKISAAEQRWVYHNVIILCARRPDRHFIALFLSAGAPDMTRAARVIEEFKAMPLLTS